MFHFTHRRIEAHICICFIAYKVYKELERIMKLMNFPLSVDKALEIAKTIPTVTIRLPHNRQKQTQTLFLTSEQRKLKPLFNLKSILGDAFPKSGADMGHPVCGDVKYGNGDDPLHRLCLHAYKLHFHHPVTHKPMEFETPIPTSFRQLF